MKKILSAPVVHSVYAHTWLYALGVSSVDALDLEPLRFITICVYIRGKL